MSEHSTPSTPTAYPARLEVEYAAQYNRVKTLFRVVLIIPIAIVYGVLTAGATQTVYDHSGQTVSTTSGGIVSGLFLATLLMILFRRRYPRWWFDFALELARFGARIGAYFVLLTDDYPSTVEEQRVNLQIDYPDVERDLNRWLPLVKWLLAIPHFLVLIVLSVGRVLRGRHRLVRDPVHRALPEGAVRLRGRCRPLVAAGRGLRLPARHRPVSAVLSPLTLSNLPAPRPLSRRSDAGWEPADSRRNDSSSRGVTDVLGSDQARGVGQSGGLGACAGIQLGQDS